MKKIQAPMAASLPTRRHEMNEPTTTEIFEANLCDCSACLSVPLSILELEVDRPLEGWEAALERLDIRVSDDHLGRRSVGALAARRLIASRRREVELVAENAARRHEELDKKRPRVVGVPAVEGLSRRGA
ncbi:MAG: hypothetical protein H0U53_00505, partial [Actinobacteria bacterium]|nr:hypothetical protein [Actinomycetota bacterium]